MQDKYDELMKRLSDKEALLRSMEGKPAEVVVPKKEEVEEEEAPPPRKGPPAAVGNSVAALLCLDLIVLFALCFGAASSCEEAAALHAQCAGGRLCK